MKTGQRPPGEIQFEEMQPGTNLKFGTLGRRKSKAKLNKSAEENQLFPRKKELENKIDDMEAEIEEGERRGNLRFSVKSVFCSSLV